MAQWTIKVEQGGIIQSFAMNGPGTRELAEAEFKRQQRETNRLGLPLMPSGEVTVEPGDPNLQPPAAITSVTAPKNEDA